MRNVMLLGIIDFFLARLASLLLKPWYTMIERGDTTRPTAVSSEPSGAVKEEKKKLGTQNVAFNNVRPIM